MAKSHKWFSRNSLATLTRVVHGPSQAWRLFGRDMVGGTPRRLQRPGVASSPNCPRIRDTKTGLHRRNAKSAEIILLSALRVSAVCSLQDPRGGLGKMAITHCCTRHYNHRKQTDESSGLGLPRRDANSYGNVVALGPYEADVPEPFLPEHAVADHPASATVSPRSAIQKPARRGTGRWGGRCIADRAEG